MRYLNSRFAQGGGGAIGVLLFLTGCGSAPQASPLSIHSGQPSGVTSIAAHPTIRGHIAIYVDEAPQRVVAGRSILIRMTVVNGLGHSVPIPDWCNGWLEAGLASRTILWAPGSLLIGCRANKKLLPGATTISRNVITTYWACSATAEAPAVSNEHRSTESIPRCAGPLHNRIPFLPPGSYRLVIDTSQFPHPVIATPTTIVLTGA